MRALATHLLVLGPVACASLDPLPLRPEPIPMADTLPIPEPSQHSLVEEPERWERAFTEEAGKVLDLHTLLGEEREALNLTHFDDVVDSAWFEHRNGRRRLELEEIRRGPAVDPGPDTSRAIRVVDGKAEGAQPGFTVEDARGHRYLVKFDPRGSLRLASSAGVITSRLYHAAGYHTPADYIVVFDPVRLVLAEGAGFEAGGQRRPMRPEDVERVLDRTDRLPDGRYLALASRFVPGVVKGPFRFKGRRKDDPNDHYRHEYRRELRGAFILAAWLNHTDLVFQNTMDVWIEPTGYLRHYLIDFASSLGSAGTLPHNPREELEHEFAFWPTMARWFTLGFHRVGWEAWEWEPIHPAIGWLPAERYDPAAWKPNWPNQAWRLRTPADGYWGAKLVASFTDDQIRAAVETGALPETAADTMADILIHRRDATVEYWYGRVTPIERPAVESATDSPSSGAGTRDDGVSTAGFVLEFDDLWLAPGRGDPRRSRYVWRFRDERRGIDWRGEAEATDGVRQRLRVRPPEGARPSRAGAPDGLAVLTVRAVRGDPAAHAGRSARVYLRWSATGYTVVGLRH